MTSQSSQLQIFYVTASLANTQYVTVRVLLMECNTGQDCAPIRFLGSDSCGNPGDSTQTQTNIANIVPYDQLRPILVRLNSGIHLKSEFSQVCLNDSSHFTRCSEKLLTGTGCGRM